MKITKLNTYCPELKKISNEKDIGIENCITKKLLEKYKTKGIYNMQGLANRKDQKRVA